MTNQFVTEEQENWEERIEQAERTKQSQVHNGTNGNKVFSRTGIAKRKNQENLSTTFVEKSIMFMLDKKGTLKGKLRKILKEK